MAHDHKKEEGELTYEDDKALRQLQFGEGCYRTRRHTNDFGFHLGVKLDDQQVVGDDEFVTLELNESLLSSYFGGYLNPEEAMIFAEEMPDEEADDYIAEITDKKSDEEKEDPRDDLSLSDYFAHLFGVTKADHVDTDEHHFGIGCTEPKPRYASRPNWVEA